MINLKDIINEYFDYDFNMIQGDKGISLDSSIIKFNNNISYNIFSIPNKLIYNEFLNFVKILKNYLLKKEMVFDRLNLYCYARFLNLKEYNKKLSLAPNLKTCFFALKNISNQDIKIFVNDKETILSKDLIIFDSSDIIMFDKEVKKESIIYISIAPVETLQSQELGIWIPII